MATRSYVIIGASVGNVGMHYGSVYINETATRSYVVAGVYINETVPAAGGFQPAWAVDNNIVVIGAGSF